MSQAPRPAVLSEPERLAELHAYQVLDTEPEPAFDGLVQVAAAIAEVPTVLVSLVDSDRQWFKARIGQDRAEGDRDSAFGDWVVRSGTELVVPDATADPRFADNPLVTGQDEIRFYAGFPLRTPAGAVLGTLCVIDREPRQLSPQQLGLLRTLADQVMSQLQSRRERLAESAFLATMGQHIRTPMNAVLAMTGRLLDTRLDPDQRDLLEAVRSSGDHLLSIIDDVLDCSKIESGDLELDRHPFELRETVESTIAQFAGAAGKLDLISHLSEDCPAIVVGDVTRLRQVLSNLVGNAVKFTEHGDVLLRAALDPEQPDPPDGGAGQVRLRFTVADTGIGIAPDRLERLFTSFSGAGLGLAISRAIVEAMGGELAATSTLGTGSEFTFSIVLGRSDDPRPALGTGTAPGEFAPLAGRSVLVVEDNNTNRRILRLQLEGYGMVCTTSSSPRDALALVGSGRSFDLAILDFSMPMMDGGQLAAALRRLPTGQRLPLILLSGPRHRDRDDDRLFAAVLTKPTRSAPLFEAITRILTPDPILAIPRPARPSQPSQPREPMAVTPSGPGMVMAPTRREGDRKLRILLAEDNEVNQKVSKLMLSKIGHQVDIAENGLDALEAVRHNVYDVVLMDLHMPVMDGLESTRRIRASLAPDRQPNIIALTASVTAEDRAACTAAGMDGYLPKPIRAGDLAAALAAVPVRVD